MKLNDCMSNKRALLIFPNLNRYTIIFSKTKKLGNYKSDLLF